MIVNGVLVRPPIQFQPHPLLSNPNADSCPSVEYPKEVLAFIVTFSVIGVAFYSAWWLLVPTKERRPWQGPRGSHRHLRRRFVRAMASLHMLREAYHGNDAERRLPRIAKSLEFRLFQDAKTMREYKDVTTLKSRLRRIVRREQQQQRQNMHHDNDDLAAEPGIVRNPVDNVMGTGAVRAADEGDDDED